VPAEKLQKENAMQLVKREYWLVTAVGALALGGALLTSPAGAAPLGGKADLKAIGGMEATVQKAHWRGRYYRHYRPYYYGYYAPRYYRRYYRPNYYYGYGPRFYGFAGRPYRHWW
jgi:hypothetical protein